MVPPNNLGPDLNGKSVNETDYRGMIGSLMYLTASRPGIQISTCICARYQANLKESHLIAVKRIFMYQKVGRRQTCMLDAKKHQLVAMSSAEAKYVAATGCCADILWVKSHLTNCDIIYEKYQLADIFIKPLDEPTFKRLIVELGMLNIDDTNPKPSELNVHNEENRSDEDDEEKTKDENCLMANASNETLNHKLVKQKEEAETEDALLKAKPSFLNVEQLIEILVNYLKPELSKLLSSHDFSNSLPTELKELLSKFKDITREIIELKKYVEKLEIELPWDLKEIPTKLEKFSSTAKIKTLDAFPSLLTKVTKALDRFVQAIKAASHLFGDQSIPSADQAKTHPVEEEKNIRQATIT
nr:hypothetical protein [Tanacetum cinerariifolium]